MASLEPQKCINTRRTGSRPRPSYTSRTLSQLPRSRDCHKLNSSEDRAKEETMALLHSGAQCTTSSSKSSTSSCHSGLGSAVITAPQTTSFTPSVSPQESPVLPSAGNASMQATSSPTTSLSPSARRQLLRSARKVGYILGETPVLCTKSSASDTKHRGVETSELGFLSSSIPSSSTAKVNRTDFPDGQKLSQPKDERETGMYNGLASAFAAPHQYRNLTAEHSPSPFAPTLNRVPPILTVDCTHVGATNSCPQRDGTGELAPDTDSQSFVSTTTMASDMFSPHPSRRSKMSPIEARFKLREHGEELPREARRSKIAKLSRHLGEPVPSNLVFPPTQASTEQAGGYVLVTYDNASPVSPLANKTATPKCKVIQPPTRSSSLRRRKRRSLQLDLDGSPRSTSSTPSASTNFSSEKDPIGSAPSKYKPTRKLSRSQSVRSRTRKHTNGSPIAGRPSESPSVENVPVHPASAPPSQAVYGTEAVTEASRKEAANEMALEKRVPLSDAQKALNVRRAQKMLSVFGEAPPTSLLSVNSKRDPSEALSRSVLGGARFKRHSISSIMTMGSSFMDMPESATFDSPVTPITPRPRVLGGEMTATPTRAPTPKDRLTPLTPLSPRRRASLSALPDTPPPFSQYFDPPSPANPVAAFKQVQPHDQANTTPTSSHPRPKAAATHSPHSSSESSASPPTPSSTTIVDRGREGQAQDLGAVFRERRMRAAKLARFFGVGYGDLYPVLIGADDDARLSESSFDSIRSARLEPFEKEQEKVKEREKKLATKRTTATRVSVTVQREVAEPGMTFASLSYSTSSLSLSSSSEISSSETQEAKLDARRRGATTVTSTPTPVSSTIDHDVSTIGCYGGLGFTTSLTPSSSSSTRRRQQGGSDAASGNADRTSRYGASGLGLGIGLGAGVFSLGRQSHRTTPGPGASKVNSSPNAGSATLGRKGSTRTTRGTPLALGQRRSLLARASCGEFGIGSPRSIDATISDTEATKLKLMEELDREREVSGPHVRVGEKIADVNEVMAKLRELR